MPSVAVKLYSMYFKFMLNKRWQSRLQNPQPAAGGEESGTAASFGVTSRPREESVSPAKPNFTDGVATKDIHIDPLTSVAIRIFLPDSCRDPHPNKSRVRDNNNGEGSDPGQVLLRRNSYDPVNEMMNPTRFDGARNQNRRNSYACSSDDTNLKSENGVYGGYNPASTGSRKLPVMLQFHGGGFVSGSNDSVANDLFCRRIAKVCDVIVLSVGYRLAPENRFPAAFDDGLKVLHWLAKQANLAECSKSLGSARGGGPDVRKTDIHRHIADAFGASMVEPWLAAHADPSRCVLLGVSCGGNIADYVSRKAVEAGKLLDPVNVVAQVLMYPFFIGSVPTHSEIRLANSYFYDKATCLIAWKLFLPEDEFNLDHPAANPLIPNRGPPLKKMPPTLTIVAEHDWMRDRAIAYSQELRKVNVDAPVYEYKDAVHEFATLGILLGSPQAQACAEDISIWVKKYISLRGHEFSY